MKAAHSVRDYAHIALALLVLLIVTVAVAFLDLGLWSTVVAMVIAVIKALLIILFFMHVQAATPLTKVVVVAGFFWLGILLFLAMSDYLARG